MTAPPATPRHADLWAGVRQGVLVGAAVLVLTLPPAGLAKWGRPPAASTSSVSSAHVAPRERLPEQADFAGHASSDDARQVADWVARTGNNESSPFVILDKRDARVFVFDARGRLIDASPVLLGATPGDDSVAGIGTRAMSEVQQDEKTTPAGRFVSQPGRNASGEDVVWVDYNAAVSMHRVRPVDPKERRLERLASNDPRQRRISYGCINVPVAFFDGVLQPAVGKRRAVVYVLPEVKPLEQVFAEAAKRSVQTNQM
ncbi:MAG TPA: hypothetical protein VNU71_20260 [Burkholderiaceae bacterium]|nr:hypothetical protein [Burkholderiaceae bacterium]